VATHNANLPVNADAEQIYAPEARDGRGKSLAKGGLDRKDVAQSVLDIMEGSEQAFRRRREVPFLNTRVLRSNKDNHAAEKHWR